MAVLVVSTDAGDFAIQEHEVSTITAAELCQLRISRVDLPRLFAETPPAWSPWGGALVHAEPPSVLRVRADCGRLKVSTCHAVTLCRGLAHNVEAVKPVVRAEKSP